MIVNGQQMCLSYAICCGRLDFVENLLAEESSPASKPDSHSLMLSVICMHENEIQDFYVDNVLIPLPVELQKNPNYCDPKIARYKIIELLLMHGVDVNFQGCDNETALHIATTLGDFNTVQLLLQHGADVTLMNDKGETPLFLAVQENMVAIAQLLVEHGARVNFSLEQMKNIFSSCFDEDTFKLAQFLYFNVTDQFLQNMIRYEFTCAARKHHFRNESVQFWAKCAAFIKENELSYQTVINDDESSYADWLFNEKGYHMLELASDNEEFEKFIKERYHREPLSYIRWLPTEVADDVVALLLPNEPPPLRLYRHHLVQSISENKTELQKRKREEEPAEDKTNKKLKQV